MLTSFPMNSGESFTEHAHDAHQLAWVRDGVLMVTIGDRHWTLPPSLALWIPAGMPHTSTAIRSAARMQGIYLPVDVLADWVEPAAVAVNDLMRGLIDLLCDEALSPATRRKAEALLPDLLIPSDSLTIDVAMPRDQRARQIAAALAVDPADDRNLAQWGREVGASARTLSRIYAAEAGIGFAQWRSRLRLRASIAHLAAGEPVSVAAARVGFSSTSAYIAAFGQLTGMTPGAYFATVGHPGLASSPHGLSG